MSTLKKIRALTSGYKTYMTVAIGVLSAFSAWGAGDIELPALFGAILVAAAFAFDRAGTAKAQKAIDAINQLPDTGSRGK